MPFLFLLTVLLLFFCFFAAFTFFCVLAWLVYKYFRDRKRARIIRLRVYQKRLKAVVAELLKQINELDQISKYSGLDRDQVWSKKYDDTLKKLLSANDKLADAQSFVDMKELNAGQESLLYVVRTIHVVNYRMREMTPNENFDDLNFSSEEIQFETTVKDADARASAAKVESIRDGKIAGTDDKVEQSKESPKKVDDEVIDGGSNAHDDPGSIIYLKKREQKGQ